MSQRLVTDVTTLALERALDGAALQQRLIASNLANLETPGFIGRHARFQDSLRAALVAERSAFAKRTTHKRSRRTLANAAPRLPALRPSPGLPPSPRLRGTSRATSRRTGQSPLEAVRPSVAASPAPPTQPNGNNVNIEAEMTALSESVLQYEVLTRLLNKKLRMVGVAIGDGK